MRRLMLLIVALVAGGLLLPGPAQADAVDDAYWLCAALERTGLTTECEVKGWGSTVDARIDTSSYEARKICISVADMMAQKTRSFDGEWKLQIFSPYSGETPIAICNLRSDIRDSYESMGSSNGGIESSPKVPTADP